MDMKAGPFWASVANGAVGWLPAISITGVFVTALVAYLAYRQALDVGRRDQWWTRAQWAIDAALDPSDDRRLAGLTVLTSLKTSRLATRQDAELFDSIARSVQASLPAVTPATVPESAPGAEGRVSSQRAELLRQATALLACDPPQEGRKPARSPISEP